MNSVMEIMVSELVSVTLLHLLVIVEGRVWGFNWHTNIDLQKKH